MNPQMSLSTPHPTQDMPAARKAWLAASACVALLHGAVQAADTSPARQLERFGALATAPAQAERGRVFFTSRHGGEWSCASCHGNPPSQPGRHASTGKPIAPMAPSANPGAFSDTAKVDKWFRRNCRDVLQRECSAGEKADVLAYLIGLKP
jgi:Domain of unknown function (DUF1924)